MGRADGTRFAAVAQETNSEAEYVREVEARLVGESGFMLFSEFDHGAWIGKFGIHRRVLRWILGNPLIAITMLRHDIGAGLFVPVEILLTDRLKEQGSTVTYVRPSSLIAVEDNPQLLAAAQALDTKLHMLITRATQENQVSLRRPERSGGAPFRFLLPGKVRAEVSALYFKSWLKVCTMSFRS
jgi:uncharacterized protein (DUF302 family)